MHIRMSIFFIVSLLSFPAVINDDLLKELAEPYSQIALT